MIEIQSLGGIALKTGDGEQVRLRSRKHTGLLLYLAMSRHRLFRREHLTSLFWTTPPDRARHSLSQAVYDLRTHLDGVLIRGPGEQLSIEGRGLSFDALEFEAAVKEGRLAEAIDLYRGPFAQNLAGAGTREFDRWVESERLRLQRLAEVAFRRYTGECESKGRWGEMCVAAMRLTEMTPLDEDAHMCLMRGLWLHGDAAAALRHYGTAIEYLARELPEGPSDRLSDLADRIRSAPSANPIENRVAERETPFLGRDREFDLLRSALHGMGTSRTTAVLIAGEAGIGKSRIVREFGRMVALEDVRLIESRCYPAEEELPYGPIVDAISPIAKEVLAAVPSSHRFARLGYLLPDFPKRPVPEDEGVDPAAWRRRLYEEIASLLRLATERRPIVWIIDDAQWIDATSAGLLHYVSRRLEGTRFLLVVTVRAPRIGRLPAKLPVTPPDGSGFTREIRLPPLTDVEIRELVLHGRPEAAEHPAVAIAQRLSAGNPFYALEVFMAAEAAAEWAQTLVDWDPLNDERLRHVLAVRFKGLPKEATRLLQCVAVLERNATPRMVAAVSGMELDAAADESGELYARGLLHDDEERLDFVNDVMRDYVYGEMSGLRRTSLHYRAGKQLELEPNPNPGILARHFHLGDDRSRAYRYAMEAARTASESGGHAEAAVMAGLARSTATDLDEELAALRIMAESELASAQLASAREHFSEIMRLQPEMIAEEKIRIQLRMVECS
ncbi:MAG: AAA family ATPase, partial [marine benthic group bacterium]|nr:AAA family ATPase [Gemmatimonadota bacterium]